MTDKAVVALFTTTLSQDHPVHLRGVPFLAGLIPEEFDIGLVSLGGIYASHTLTEEQRGLLPAYGDGTVPAPVRAGAGLLLQLNLPGSAAPVAVDTVGGGAAKPSL
ncbi:hypothetical protein [Streptomyces sp. G1]|uniref:hypothetical protein n=1 Tax=Streptomyces sp. G1 TaxID=361572 RepID=UPI002030703F|nr:hypothetical protein [Streptomyces sp. G1]MCM1965099.1 hypothetical protein [Streptomyces sp. G1]